jgi:hypothetical protein
MGVYLSRINDPELYKDAYEEAQRIIRISDEIRISLEKVTKQSEYREEAEESGDGKLTTSRLAQKLGLKTSELLEKMIALGYLEVRDSKNYITSKGKDAGGEFRMSPRFGPYFLWPENLPV